MCYYPQINPKITERFTKTTQNVDMWDEQKFEQDIYVTTITPSQSTALIKDNARYLS